MSKKQNARRAIANTTSAPEAAMDSVEVAESNAPVVESEGVAEAGVVVKTTPVANPEEGFEAVEVSEEAQVSARDESPVVAVIDESPFFPVSTEPSVDAPVASVAKVTVPVVEEPVKELIKEEVKAPVIPAPVGTPAAATEGKVARPSYPATLLKGSLVDAYNKLPLSARLGIDRVLVYCDVMAPNKTQDPKVGKQQQVTLYRALLGILNTPEQFNRNLSLLLLIIDENSKGAFAERYVMRFMDSVELEAEDRRLFAFLITALRVLAPVKTRKALSRTVDIKTRIYEDKGFSALSMQARERLITFFSGND